MALRSEGAPLRWRLPHEWLLNLDMVCQPAAHLYPATVPGSPESARLNWPWDWCSRPSRGDYGVLITTVTALTSIVTRALSEEWLEEKLNLYAVPRLILMDEIGYLPVDRAGIVDTGQTTLWTRGVGKDLGAP